MASDRYTPQQLADMARRLDECIEVSAVCMDLALAGQMHRKALSQVRMSGRQNSAADAGGPLAHGIDPASVNP